MSSPSKPVPPGTPPPSPPPGGPTRPTPVAPPKFGDDLLAVADAVFETPARRDPMGAGSAIPPVAVKETGGPVQNVPAVASGRDDGRVAGKGGAATFTLPPTPPAWRP